MIFYTYFIKWSSTNMKYYGARGCNTLPKDDFWHYYFTSSKYVKEYRKQFGEPDVIEIRKIFNDKKEAFEWERRVLVKTKSKKSKDWLNRYDMSYNGAFGPKNHGDKVSKAMKGLVKSPDHRENLSKAISGSRWVNDGITQRQLAAGIVESFLIENPSFMFGMLPFGEQQREKMSKTRLKLIDEGKIIMPSNLGGTAWNKGLTKETSEKLQEIGSKISKAKTGVPYNGDVWNKGKTYRCKPREYKNLWYTNGTENIQVREGIEPPVGYYRGRTTGWNTHP